MTTLTDLLNDIADEAKRYDGTERAISAARRRRRMTQLAPVAAAVVLAVGVAAVWLPLRPAPTGEPADWLPAQLVVPEQDPPALPTDRGVRPAVLAYKAKGLGGINLLTVDGSQYTIPPGDEDAQLVGISPDGRWLLRVLDGRLTLRDLIGTTETSWPIPPMAVAAYWSPDSGRVAVQGTGKQVDTEVDGQRIRGFVGGPRPEVRVIDLRTLDSRTVSVASIPEAEVIALSAAGDLAVQASTPASTPVLEMSLLDGETGASRRHVSVDVTPWLTERELRARQMLTGRLGVDGRTLFTRPGMPFADGGSAGDDVLAVDIESGQVIRRYALPDPVRAPNVVDPDGTVTTDLADIRRVVAVRPDGLLLLHTLGPGPSPAAELEVLDTATGERQVRTALPAGVQLLKIRG